MPFKRNYRKKTYKKRTAYKKRSYRKRTPVRGIIKITRKLPEINIYNTNASGVPTITSNSCLELGTPIQNFQTTYDIPFAMKFQLNQLINPQDITNLCDKYKITSAKVVFYFGSNNAPVNSTASLPSIQYIVDHDDVALSGVSVNALREKMGVRTKYFTSNRNTVSMSVRPKVAAGVFNTGTIQPIAYSVPSKALYINSAYPNVEHYGIKGIISNVNLPALANSTTTYFKVDVMLTVIGKDIQ